MKKTRVFIAFIFLFACISPSAPLFAQQSAPGSSRFLPQVRSGGGHSSKGGRSGGGGSRSGGGRSNGGGRSGGGGGRSGGGGGRSGGGGGRSGGGGQPSHGRPADRKPPANRPPADRKPAQPRDSTPRDPAKNPTGPREPANPRDPIKSPTQPKEPASPRDPIKSPTNPRDPVKRPPLRTPPATKPPAIVAPRFPKPAPITDPSKIIPGGRDRSTITPPAFGPDRMPITLQPIKGAPGLDHTRFITDPAIVRTINEHNRAETTRGRYYWHEYGGRRYCHYYDAWGYHWYGWYLADAYFWARWHHGWWWWYDPYYDRWCYWHDGYWWWQNPTRVEVVYVYVNDNYYQYDRSKGGSVLKPDPAQQPDQDPQLMFYSDDGTRMVQVLGKRNEAFLYDVSQGGEPQFLAHLADGVVIDEKAGEQKGVQFINSENGAMVIVTYQKEIDGQPKTFSKVFDSNGNPVGDSQPPAQDASFPDQPPAGADESALEKGMRIPTLLQGTSGALEDSANPFDNAP